MLLRSGRREGLDPDLASSLKLKSVVSSPNKRKKSWSSGTTKRQKLGLIPRKENIIIIIISSQKKIWIFIIRPSLMEVSSLSPRVPPGNLGQGWFFVRNPLPSGTNYCLISLRVKVGQWVWALFMQRFWFCFS